MYYMSFTISNGRFGNQLIRNLAVSFISEKHDLHCEYSSSNSIEELGINLFVGKNKFSSTINLTDDNYFEILEKTSLRSNLNSDEHYFQTKDISRLIVDYLHSTIVKDNIIRKNLFQERYKNNNDLLIHIRLGDISHFNPGIKYYLKAISNTNFDNIYITTDEREHLIIKQIQEKYPKCVIIDYDIVKTLQFSSTCKNVILSHGTFSALIGYLSFFSTVTYPEYNKMWFGDVFSIKEWIQIPLCDYI